MGLIWSPYCSRLLTRSCGTLPKTGGRRSGVVCAWLDGCNGDDGAAEVFVLRVVRAWRLIRDGGGWLRQVGGATYKRTISRHSFAPSRCVVLESGGSTAGVRKPCPRFFGWFAPSSEQSRHTRSRSPGRRLTSKVRRSGRCLPCRAWPRRSGAPLRCAGGSSLDCPSRVRMACNPGGTSKTVPGRKKHGKTIVSDESLAVCAGRHRCRSARDNCSYSEHLGQYAAVRDVARLPGTNSKCLASGTPKRLISMTFAPPRRIRRHPARLSHETDRRDSEYSR